MLCFGLIGFACNIAVSSALYVRRNDLTVILALVKILVLRASLSFLLLGSERLLSICCVDFLRHAKSHSSGANLSFAPFVFFSS